VRPGSAVPGARGEADGRAVDGQHCRAQVRRVTALAEEVRSSGGRLASSGICGVDWHSAAARAFRDRVGEEATRLRAVACAVDEAAEALARHALALDAVDRLVGP
jgi:hypothetical protein